jgi:hypothetical protein
MVDIETGESLTASVDDLERFARALDAIRGTTGAAASLDSARGAVSASFSVDAADAVAAADLGVTAFRQALATAGLGDSGPTRVAVEQIAVAETVSA